MDIFINTFIFLFAIQIWTMIGYGILSCLKEYDATESQLLSCLLWFVIVVNWMNIKLNEILDEKFKT